MQKALEGLYGLDLKQDKYLKPTPKKGHTVRDFIYTTYEYDRFRFLNSNRDISIANKKKLLKSLERNNVFGASTIIVKEHSDGYLYIYEGQHRYESLKELGEPIDYIINQELEEEDISLINTASESWELKDFLKQYLSNKDGENYESYYRFNNIWKKYGTETEGNSVAGFNFTNLLYLVCDGTYNRFKTGKLIFTEDSYYKKIKLLNTLNRFLVRDEKDGDKIVNFGTLPEKINTRIYIKALIYVLNNDDNTQSIENWDDKIDTDILEKKLITLKDRIANLNYSNHKQYIEKLAEIYNMNQKKRFLNYTTIQGGKEKIWKISDK